MAESLRKLAGWPEILATSEDLRAEVLAGELFTSPRSRPPHGRVQGVLAHRLGGPFDYDGDPGGWWILPETDVSFSAHDIVSPDLAGWRRTRVPVFPEERPIEIAPDWVCEVLSPTTARHDRVAKADLYARGGVGHYWLVDPGLRTLEALVLESGRWLRLGAWTDGDRARVAPFEAVEIDIGGLFPPLA